MEVLSLSSQCHSASLKGLLGHAWSMGKQKNLGLYRLGSLVWPCPSLNGTKHLQTKAQRLEISKQNKNVVYRSGTQLWILQCLMDLDSWGKNHFLTRCCSFATYRSGNVFNIKIAEEIGNAQKGNPRRIETSEPSTMQAEIHHQFFLTLL